MPSLRPELWWREMRERSNQTRITLSNIIYDWRERRLATELIRDLINAIGDAWDPEEIPLAEPGRVLYRVVDADQERYLCQGRPIALGGADCSRVMAAQDLLEFNLDPSVLHIPVRGFITKKQVRDLEHKGLTGAAMGKMRTLRPLAWITRTRELEHACAVPETAANRVRDALGLHYLQTADHLLEVRYPPRSLDVARVAVPTFIEGCPSPIYRSKDSDDGWGRAVDMEILEDGLPEAVHTELEFTSDFRIRGVGALRPPLPSLDEERILEKMPARWDCAVLEDLEVL